MAKGKPGRSKNLHIIRLRPEVWESRRFREANPDRRMDKPCVYVGSTAREPAARLDQHLSGVRSSRIVKRYGTELLQRKMRNLRPVPAAKAEAEERRLAERLRRRGYGVWQK
jgi:hypothetical protein